MSDTIKCPRCDGEGGLEPIEYYKQRYGMEKIPCQLCGGDGFVTAEQMEWHKVGAAISQARHEAGLGIREAAVLLNLPPSVVSSYEQGLLCSTGWAALSTVEGWEKVKRGESVDLSHTDCCLQGKKLVQANPAKIALALSVGAAVYWAKSAFGTLASYVWRRKPEPEVETDLETEETEETEKA